MKATRKRKAQDVPAKDGPLFLTYTGNVDEVGVMGIRLLRNVPVMVPDAVAAKFAAHPNFEVSRGDAD